MHTSYLSVGPLCPPCWNMMPSILGTWARANTSFKGFSVVKGPRLCRLSHPFGVGFWGSPRSVQGQYRSSHHPCTSSTSHWASISLEMSPASSLSSKCCCTQLSHASCNESVKNGSCMSRPIKEGHNQDVHSACCPSKTTSVTSLQSFRQLLIGWPKTLSNATPRVFSFTV